MPASDQTAIRDSTVPVTIILPCHNHAKWLRRAVDSIAEQDYANKSVVIIDDGSADDSYKEAVKIAEHYQNQCNISVLHNTIATGPSAARNKGIVHAWDDTLIFGMLDADDTYLPGKISKSVNKIMENPTVVGIVYGDVILENHLSGTYTHEYREPYSRKRLEQECMISNTPFISKYVLSEVGLYDEGMRTAEDWDLQLRITSKFTAIHIPEPLSTYSITGENAAHTIDETVWAENWQKIRSRYGK